MTRDDQTKLFDLAKRKFTEPVGRAWIAGGWRVIVGASRISKGRDKGKYKVYYWDLKSSTVPADKIKTIQKGGKK